jgi:hypothetical protein
MKNLITLKGLSMGLICLIGSFAVQAQSVNKKTVIYKIRSSQGESISKNTCKQIDQLFLSKNGILSSETSPVTKETRVSMLDAVPEADLKAIFISQKLEIETIQVISNEKK